MRNNNKVTLILFFIVMLCYGCKKGIPSNITTTDPITGNSTPGQVTISGKVTKDNGIAAGNTMVTIGPVTITTSTDGTYTLTVTPDNNDRVIVKFSSPGYIDTWKTFAVETGATYSGINVSLLSVTTNTFTAAIGGSVSSATTGVTMSFAANGVVKDDGTTYTGNVTVETSGASASSYLPGDERAVDANNNQVVLVPYAGLYFRLKGQAGEILKLSKPMTYIINAAGVLDPAVSPKVWYFNEATGLWAESGSATLVNKSYIGSVSNVGFLKFAVPYASTLLRLTVKDVNNNIPAGITIYNLRYDSGGYLYDLAGQANINSKGICLLYVPASKVLRLLYGFNCDPSPPVTVQALPAATKTEYRLTPVLTKCLTSITGRVDDCTFQPVSGTVQLNIDGVIYNVTLVNGSYTFNVVAYNISTPSNAILTVYDVNNKVIAQNSYVPLFAGTAYQIPSISTCTKPLTGTLTYTVGGQVYTITAPNDTLTYSVEYDSLSGKFGTILRGSHAGKGFYMTSLNTSAGTYDVYTGSFNGAPGNNYFVTWGLFTPGTITYTKYRTGTTIVEGTFKANTTLNFCVGCANKTVEVDGSFKLEQ